MSVSMQSCFIDLSYPSSFDPKIVLFSLVVDALHEIEFPVDKKTLLFGD